MSDQVLLSRRIPAAAAPGFGVDAACSGTTGWSFSYAYARAWRFS